MKKLILFVTLLLCSLNVYALAPITTELKYKTENKNLNPGDIITIDYIIKCNSNCDELSPKEGTATIRYNSYIFGIVSETNNGFIGNNGKWILNSISGYTPYVTETKNQLLIYNYSFPSENYEVLEENKEYLIASIKFKVKENVVKQDTSIYLETGEHDLICYSGNACGKAITNTLDYHINGLNDNSYLKSLNVNKGKLMPEFDKEINSYVVYVDYNVSNINIGASCEEKCILTGRGNQYLVTGENKFIITSKAESGSERKYYLTVIRAADERSGDSSLKNVVLKNKDDLKTVPYDFVMTQYNYNITVPYDVKSILVEAKTNDLKATYNAKEEIDLKVGDNRYTIEVVAENGLKSEYVYNIKRLNEEEAVLKDLKIYGYELMPSFDPNIYEYTINFDKNVNSLDFGYELNKTSKVNIFGNSNLKSNPNDIKIKVIGDTNGNEMTYTIHLNEVPTVGNLYIVIGILIAVILTLTIIIIILNKKYRILKDKSV